jgi:ABC-type transport system involved in multi-copper enzyme maturation permease subunit
MNKVSRYALITFAANVVLFVILIGITAAFNDNLDVALTLLLMVPILALLGEIICGIAFTISETKRDLGKGMLIGVGITVLIGFSVCGILIGI